MSVFVLTALLPLLPGEPAKAGPEARALAYLVREVPRWAAENRCYSCHNNGDAARALYLARHLGRAVPEQALADTTRWLQKPAGWDHNGGEGPQSDKKLARLQFAATLPAARAAGLARDRDALAQAAEMVAALQDRDGSWVIEPEGTLGSPATHGTTLATTLARRTLVQIDSRKYEAPIARADGWLRKKKVVTVLDAAAVLLGLRRADDEAARRQRAACLEVIRKGECKEGGWGPYVRSAAEPFDTAVVLLALQSQPETEEIKALLGRGRAHLLKTQEEDGSWRETTRPPDAVSYAQRVATTGWALQALLLTSPQTAPAPSPP
jgi:hypothetical protein